MLLNQTWSSEAQTQFIQQENLCVLLKHHLNMK